ncbi:MAG: alanine racemase [Actinomycetota bacterium]|nr:alanine racemase [Actinomycetota bacterium]
MTSQRFRPAWAEVDLAAVGENLRAAKAVAGEAEVWAVVKADGYGHGAEPVARAALTAGATGLAVALVEEGVALRQGGVEAPILLLSEPPLAAMGEVVGRRLTPTLYSHAGLEALDGAVATASGSEPFGVQVKLDTGMHRVGAPFAVALDIACSAHRNPRLSLDGVWTHFAVADEPERSEFTTSQCARFDRFCEALADAGISPPLRHVANSAGLFLAGASYDMVRLGISLYGYQPNPAVPVAATLRPALSLVARVVQIKELDPGEGLSYGLRYRLGHRSVVATVPLGYADGVPRRLAEAGGQVLVGGQRRPIAGTVTMDQFLVDCGPRASVEAGDEVVLLGRQGDDEITADDWAGRLGTISYEVLCGIGPRVPRLYRS